MHNLLDTSSFLFRLIVNKTKSDYVVLFKNRSAVGKLYIQHVFQGQSRLYHACYSTGEASNSRRKLLKLCRYICFYLFPSHQIQQKYKQFNYRAFGFQVVNFTLLFDTCVLLLIIATFKIYCSQLFMKATCLKVNTECLIKLLRLRVICDKQCDFCNQLINCQVLKLKYCLIHKLQLFCNI